MTRKCENCEFWEKCKREMPMSIGSCHRHAPAKSGINILATDSWPTTYHYDWCGEFKEKEE